MERIDKISFWDNIYYKCYRGFVSVKYFFRSKYQVLKYGFDLREAWNFNSWHSEFITPRLKVLRTTLHGNPTGTTFEEWEVILDKIIWSFEHFNDEIMPQYSDDYDHSLEVSERDGMTVFTPLNKTGTVDYTECHAHSSKVQEGLDLFAKYYRHLWD
ncbi:MAG: hypothetical protein WAO78_19230 [Roseovarius sp.]